MALNKSHSAGLKANMALVIVKVLSHLNAQYVVCSWKITEKMKRCLCFLYLCICSLKSSNSRFFSHNYPVFAESVFYFCGVVSLSTTKSSVYET